MIKKILDSVKPSKEEVARINKIVASVFDKIKVKDAKVVLGGSWAKGTWLKDNNEVDLFVKFDYSKFKDKSDKISLILKKSLKKFKVTKLKGSRDYYQVKKEDIVFEIIPILDIKKAIEAKNITDVSPLHSKWVNKNNRKDDIRLVKAFAKANKIYGAETHIRGFSGYVLEILTIHYGGFLKLVKNVSKWREKTIIDTEKLLKNPLKELNKSKIKGPLILVDPVDKNRNAAAVVSKEKYDLFIKKCKEFVKKPSEKFFNLVEDKIPKGSLVVEFKVKGKKDVVGGKMFRLFNKINRQLQLYGFKVVKSGFFLDTKGVFWFKFKSSKLSKKVKIKGPPAKDEKNLARFKKKHKIVILSRGFVYANGDRKFTNANDLVRALLRKEKVGFVIRDF